MIKDEWGPKIWAYIHPVWAQLQNERVCGQDEGAIGQH